MCLICIELDKMAMTAGEARRALGEMRDALDPSHVDEVELKIEKVEKDATESGQS